MNSKTCWGFLLLILLYDGYGPLTAQVEGTTRNITRLRPGMAWEIEKLDSSQTLKNQISPNQTVSRPVEKSPSESSSRQIVGVGRMGLDHRYEETTGNQGTKVRLILRDYLLTKQADGSYELEVILEDEDSREARLRADRLPEFSWMEKLQPVSLGKVDGVECHIFAANFDGKPPTGEDIEAGRADLLAAVGVADKFPRRLEKPGKILRFIPLPREQPSNLPPEALQAVQEYQEKLRKEIQRYALPR